MTHTIRLTLIVSCLLLASTEYANTHLQHLTPAQQVGLFKRTDPRLDGLVWGNWGSRPYEYFWIAQAMSVKNKKVIDLGVGLPSQYNWYDYVVQQLQPAYYAGIDVDDRIIHETIHRNNYDILHMSMADLQFHDKTFDIAYCISTFEHINYATFMRCIQEAHRVLKDDGLLIITLDEQWDKNITLTHSSNWNNLEQSVPNRTMIENSHQSFGLPDFLFLIQDYFVLANDDATIDFDKKIISSRSTGALYYQRTNKDQAILHSPALYNSCVSYAILKKK